MYAPLVKMITSIEEFPQIEPEDCESYIAIEVNQGSSKFVGSMLHFKPQV